MKYDMKALAHDFWYGKPHQERRLGDLYIDKTGLYKHREWRGFKDTMYYFYNIWMYNYAHMVMDVIRYGGLINFAKGVWRYRWVGQTYLPVLHWFDRGMEGIAYDAQLVEGRGIEMHVARTYALPILLLIQTVDTRQGHGQQPRCRSQHLTVVKRHNIRKRESRRLVHTLPYMAVEDKQTGIRMECQGRHTRRGEVAEYGNRHGLVCQYGKIGNSPTGAVAAAERYLVAHGYARLLEKDVHAAYLARQITERKRRAAIVRKSRLVPVLTYGLLQKIEIVFHSCRYFIPNPPLLTKKASCEAST